MKNRTLRVCVSSTVLVVAALCVGPAAQAWAQDAAPNATAIALIDFNCDVTWLVSTDDFAGCRRPDAEDPDGQAAKGDGIFSSVTISINGLGLEGAIGLTSQVVPDRCFPRGSTAPPLQNHCRTALADFVSALVSQSTECALFGVVFELDGTAGVPPESGVGSFRSARSARFYCSGTKDQIITHSDRAMRAAIALAPIPKPPRKDPK